MEVDKKLLDEIVDDIRQIGNYLNERTIEVDNESDNIKDKIDEALKGIQDGLEENPHIHIDWIDKAKEDLVELKYNIRLFKEKDKGIIRDFVMLAEKIEQLTGMKDEIVTEDITNNPSDKKDEQTEQSSDIPKEDSSGLDEQ